MSEFTASHYLTTDDAAYIMVNLDWSRVDSILSKGSLEDGEVETIFEAIEEALRAAQKNGIDTRPEYDDDDED